MIKKNQLSDKIQGFDKSRNVGNLAKNCEIYKILYIAAANYLFDLLLIVASYFDALNVIYRFQRVGSSNY